MLKISKLKVIFFVLVAFAISFLFLFLKAPTKELSVDAYNVIRPLFLSKGGNECLEKLKERGVHFSRMAEFTEGQCVVRNPVKVNQFSSTKLNSAVILSCPTAAAVDDWLSNIDAKNIKHLGSYNCRSQRKSRIRSEHSFGTAIDISEIDEAKISIDWGEATKIGKLLQAAYTSACNYFVNVITPDDDALHQDHFHLDIGFGTGCKLKPAIKRVKSFLTAVLRGRSGDE